MVRSWADTKANGGSGLCDLRIQHEAPFVTGSVRSCDPTVEAFGSRAAPTLELKGAPRVRNWADTKANGGSGLCDLRIQHEAPFVTGSVRSCDPTVEAFGSRAAPTLELKGAPRVRPFRVYIVTGRLWHALS
ncbi:hypothetical protein NDU88_003626 [Pleurodeles waltl]|uniref:Uncharacterized protein n=1 Tax=Pleurodeles waltl TaxID=8319 RepID=A0AAV7NJY2_PLEWA|nr:hypothetical protein NDU88_003626 [Pleurodeles waltl]